MFLVEWPGGDWQTTLKFAGAIVGIYLAILWLTLIFWVYRDVRQRTRDPIVQTTAVLLVLLFFLPGHWVYLILRPRYTLAELYERSLEEEALLQELEDQKACPTCKRRVHDEYLICPSCRTSLKEPCRTCGKPLSYAWLSCPYCAAEKPMREQPRIPRPAAASIRAPQSPPQQLQPQQKARPAPVPRRPPQPQPVAATPRPETTVPRDPFVTRPPRRIGDDAIIDSTAE
ncbi:MAG: zinc ribbon domain-containing protein [Tepidiformaceae bacterium]